METGNSISKAKVKIQYNSVYIFDKNNLIFSDVIYGPNKKAKSKISVMTDYVHGKIYRVTKDFLQRFQTSNPRIHPRKDDIV